MRILLISDIHANLEGLEACLDASPSCDLVVNLGDVVGYGASPNEVIDKVRILGDTIVRGNHDKACAGESELEYFNPVAALAVLWTRTTLTTPNLHWLRELPIGPVRVEKVSEVQFVHGSPIDEDDYVITLADALPAIIQSAVPITFFGHPHVQGGFKINGKDAATLRPAYQTSDEVEKFELRLDANTRYLLNPGSVGQPRDGDWRAAFAVFDTEARVLTYYRVPYNIKGAQKRIRDAELPERLATRLKEGK